MTYFEYDQTEVDSDSSDFLSHLDRNNSSKVASYTVLNLADGLASLLGLDFEAYEIIAELEELTGKKLEKLLQKQAKVISPFLESDQLPNSKSYQRWHWTSVRFRALLQVAIAYVQSRVGDKQANQRCLSWLKKGPFLQRFTLLCLLEGLQFEDADFPDRNWTKALQEAIRNSSDIGGVYSDVAESYGLDTLDSDLSDLAKRVSPNESSLVYLSLVKMARNDRQRFQFAEAALPSLDRSQLESWFASLSRADTDNRNERKVGEPTQLEPVIRLVLERFAKVATPMEFGDFLRQPRGSRYPQYVSSVDVEPLRQVTEIANPNNDPNIDHRIKTAKSILCSLVPERDTKLLLESGGFEKVCSQLAGDLQPVEVPDVLARAKQAIESEESFEGHAAGVLLNDCGQQGRDFVTTHLDDFDLISIQYLHWFLQKRNLAQMAAAAVSADLTEKSTKGLLAAVKRKHKVDPTGPEAFVAIMEACNRFAAYDMESGEVPPDYQWLIKTLCKASAGTLRPTSIRLFEAENEGWTIKMKCLDEAMEVRVNDHGDWFDVGAVETALGKVLKKKGLKDQFVDVWLDSGQCAAVVFGNPTSVRKVARLAGVPVRKDHPDDLEEHREKLVAAIRKKV